jgi:hypothetical protein
MSEDFEQAQRAEADQANPADSAQQTNQADQVKPKYGVASLSEQERAILTQPRDVELKEFERLNSGMDHHALENRIEIFHRQMILMNGLFDIMRKDIPLELLRKWGWEKLWDVCLGDPEASDSHYKDHAMNDIVFPDPFRKAWIESVRDDTIYFLEHSE